MKAHQCEASCWTVDEWSPPRCPHRAKWKVTAQGLRSTTSSKLLCGTHVRRFRGRSDLRIELLP